MNIIIPLGGIGQRFSDQGYIKPKPLIKVLGKEIIFWTLDSLNIQPTDKLYIPYNEFLDSYSFQEAIQTKYPDANLVSLPNTSGPAETLQLCLNHFNISGRIALLDGDSWYQEDILHKIRSEEGSLTTYFTSTSKEPIYSYITMEEGVITEIKEKIKISDNANSGCYVFNDAEEIKELINTHETEKIIYISDLISLQIKQSKVFKALKLNDEIHVLGTPQQIIEFSKKYTIEPKRFVFDLDNTLVTYPRVHGDYSSVEPIYKTINYLRNLKEQGHYIIIYTARRMRTHRGNVGAVISDIGEITIETLKKFEIPYDELFFGKPYAHYYIDDLMVNPKSDLNKELGFYMENVEPRHFNNLEFKENTVIKSSEDPKIKGEAYYYSEITKWHIKKYFPKKISFEDNKLEIERIHGTNFSTLLVNEILTEGNFKSLLEIIREIHNTNSTHPHLFTKYPDYSTKLQERFSIFNFASLGVSSSELNEVIENVQDLNGAYKIIHGDLVFSNIILSKEGKIKLVDVKGLKDNELSIFGDPRYDYAKIYQSILGYDEILLNSSINESYRNKFIKIFEDEILKSSFELRDIKKITKSLLYSLIPLHNETEKFKSYIDLARSIKY